MHDFTHEVRRALRGSRLGGAAEQSVVEELAQHAQQHYEEMRARGVAHDAAVESALASIGFTRGAGGAAVIAAVLADARFGLRLLRRRPGFAFVAVFTLALAIGVSTAIFSAVNAVLLRPLPFTRPDELYMLWEKNPEKNWYKETAAPANMLDWKERVGAFADVAAYADFFDEKTVTLDGLPQIMKTVPVTGNFFRLLGVAPLHGTTFRDEETWRGSGEPSLVLSHQVWAERFGADPHVVGSTIMLDGEAMRIIGVMPGSFTFPREDADAWIAFSWPPANRTENFFRRAHWVRPIARLKPGVRAADAEAQLVNVAAALEREYPRTNRRMGAGMTPLHEFIVGNTRTPLLVLLGAVGLLVVIACANIANLMLVRVASRVRELSVRTALGAGRARLVGQIITENLTIALLGGVVGLAFGWGATRVLERLQPAGLLRVSHFAIDARVAAFALLLALATGLLFGAVPALWTARASSRALRDRSGGLGRGGRRVAGGIVVAEVALALALTAGSGLLVRSFQRLQDVDPGFDGRGVTAFTIQLPTARYATDEQVALAMHEIRERVAGIRGVRTAAFASAIPLEDRGYTSDMRVEGRAQEEFATEVVHRIVSADYFRTMGAPLKRGRDFNSADRLTSSPVLIVNEEVARTQFPNQDPLGQRIAFDRYPDSTTTWYTIVGVAGSERQADLATPPRIEVLHPVSQAPSTRTNLLVSGTLDVEALTRDVRTAVRAVNADIPITDVRTIDQVRHAAVAQQRFLMSLLLMFGIVALVLSFVGVYGVTSQVARQRTQEIAIRVALGARREQIIRLITGYGARLAAGGIVAGLMIWLVAGRLMQSLLYDVKGTDALALVTAILVQGTAAVLAATVPARRATRVDPIEAMRAVE